MTKYNGGMKWTHKAAFALVTIAIAATALEWVASAMRFPDPDTMAVREQVLAAQLTAQAVPPDENPWIETFGGTRSYLNLANGFGITIIETFRSRRRRAPGRT